MMGFAPAEMGVEMKKFVRKKMNDVSEQAHTYLIYMKK